MSQSNADRQPDDEPDDELVQADARGATRDRKDIVHVGPSPHAVTAVQNPDSPTVERLRRMAMQLLVGSKADASRVLTVISPQAQDGRSFVAANLAVLLAQAGRRTLLIDGDLRSPVQHELFGAANNKGLSNLARGRADWSVIQPVNSIPGLYIIPAGPAVMNPGEIVSRSTLEDLFVELLRPCDQIIIDTPPGAPYADGQALSSYAGSALLVLRRHHTQMKHAKTLVDSVTTGGADILGTVLNDY
jgi:receptor protein-tyrosine kinase